MSNGAREHIGGIWDKEAYRRESIYGSGAYGHGNLWDKEAYEKKGPMAY